VDKAQFLQRRKKRYMAQILEAFERDIESLLSREAAGAVQAFKGLVRNRLDALANDATDVFHLGNGTVNGAAQEIRDRLSPTGRP
jgi:hypothetical protein